MFRANLSRVDDQTRKTGGTQNLVFIALGSEEVNRGESVSLLLPRRIELKGMAALWQNAFMTTVVLLTISNIFMTFAWYGHLKYRHAPLFKVILISWLIAFAEYCFQVPANRIGSYEFSAAQLKTIQEVITLSVLSVFSVLYLKEPIRWNYAVGFVTIVAAVFVIFKKW
jgi:uncharacterized protein